MIKLCNGMHDRSVTAPSSYSRTRTFACSRYVGKMSTSASCPILSRKRAGNRRIHEGAITVKQVVYGMHHDTQVPNTFVPASRHSNSMHAVSSILVYMRVAREGIYESGRLR